MNPRILEPYSRRMEELMKRLLMQIYERLYNAYGPRHWWPGETPFEVMVGAILTQNTSWRNVEKAIQNLKRADVLNIVGVSELRKAELARLIRPSGFYRLKTERLMAFVDFLFDHYHGNLNRMRREEAEILRPKLLRVKGIGPETADSILLYGLRKTIFVVDAYTKRVLSRHGIISEGAPYEEVQRLFMNHLPPDERLFNEYHALLVHLGKNVCKKIPKCDICPIKGLRIENREWKIDGKEIEHGTTKIEDRK